MCERGVYFIDCEKAELPSWRLAFTIYSDMWCGGVADILPSEKGERVVGVVYNIPSDDVRTLDKYEGRVVEEGVETGMYRRQHLPVRMDDGWRTVLTYLVNIAHDKKRDLHFKPSSEYMNTIIKGANEHELDPEYIDYLNTISTE